MEKTIYISDFPKLVKDLKQLSPNLQKDLFKGLNEVLRPLVQDAKNFVPGTPPTRGWREQSPTYMSNGWQNDTIHRGRDAALRWTWDAAAARRGIKISRSKSSQDRAPGGGFYKTNALGIRNTAVPGIIFELAQPDTPRKGAAMASRNSNAPQDFRNAVKKKNGNRPRLIYKVARLRGEDAMKDLDIVLQERLYKFVRRG
jgi:hypothetical protein